VLGVEFVVELLLSNDEVMPVVEVAVVVLVVCAFAAIAALEILAQHLRKPMIVIT
jgi:hypothetical protein